MNQQNYQSSIAADITPAEAFDSINHVNEWWAKNFEGHSQKLNDVFTVRFGETFVTFKISEVIRNKKIVWQVMDCNLHWLQNKTEWNGTSIMFEISPMGDSTQVIMTHIGLVPGIECFEQCERGWNHFIKESLFKLLTEHEGVPR